MNLGSIAAADKKGLFDKPLDGVGFHGMGCALNQGSGRRTV